MPLKKIFLVGALLTLNMNTYAQEHTDDDIVDGEVVQPTTTQSDDTAIKSIEQDGKRYIAVNLSDYAKQVNESTWSPDMKVNTAMTVKMQVLLDWNHASPGPIDGGWGMNSKKALANFQKMHHLEPTGKMDEATWVQMTQNIDPNQPVLVSYTITKEDAKGPYKPLPGDAESRSKLKALGYESIQEMLGERFHMSVSYLNKLNANKKFTEGETIAVINPGKPFEGRVTRVVADRNDKTLYAYDGDTLVATYPTTIGSVATATPSGKFKVINKVKMPHYKATVNRDSETDKKTFILSPGPNSPVGVVWMGLNKPSYGIHGSPLPEGISRQASLGCIRLTNWDVLELHANIQNGASVEIR